MFNSTGPIPIENSYTCTPVSFANKKCPPSCTNTISPRIIINNINVKIMCPPYKILIHKINASATNIMLSSLSKIPPCPGIKFEKSFIL